MPADGRVPVSRKRNRQPSSVSVSAQTKTPDEHHTEQYIKPGRAIRGDGLDSRCGNAGRVMSHRKLRGGLFFSSSIELVPFRYHRPNEDRASLLLLLLLPLTTIPLLITCCLGIAFYRVLRGCIGRACFRLRDDSTTTRRKEGRPVAHLLQRRQWRATGLRSRRMVL